MNIDPYQRGIGGAVPIFRGISCSF